MKFKFREVSSYIVIFLIAVVIAQHMNVVVSESMEPILERGDIILVDSNVNNIEVGDIIVYYGTWTETPENIVHRVVKKEIKNKGSVAYITKGDHNPAPDPVIVYPDQIRFKVISKNNIPLKIPKIGYITLMVRNL